MKKPTPVLPETDTEVAEALDVASESAAEVPDAEAEAVSDETTAASESGEITTAAADDPKEIGADTKRGSAFRRINWSRFAVFGILPILALLLGAGVGYEKWLTSSARAAAAARVESVQAAKDSTIAILSYRPDTVERQLGDARNRLTGRFRDSYTQLTNEVVIPGAKQKQISSDAKVPAAGSVSATANHAVALVFVDQTVVVGTGAPTDTASVVKVTMDKINNRWLISAFDPE